MKGVGLDWVGLAQDHLPSPAPDNFLDGKSYLNKLKIVGKEI